MLSDVLIVGKMIPCKSKTHFFFPGEKAIIISYRDPVACVSHKKEGGPRILEICTERLFSNLSHKSTIKGKVPFSDVRTTNNIKALGLEGDDFRVDGAFVHFRVPAEEASKQWANGEEGTLL